MRTIIDIIEDQLSRGVGTGHFTLYDENAGNCRTLAMAELRLEALNIAALLPNGEAVLIVQTDPFAFIKSFFGCLYAGAIAVPLVFPMRKNGLESLNNLLEQVGSKYCLTSENNLKRLKMLYGGEFPDNQCNWIAVDKIDFNEGVCVDAAVLPKPDQAALIQFTSGSTGNPKGVVVSHENIVENSKLIQACFRNTTESVSVCWLPPYHDMGLIDGIIQPVFTGFHSILMTPASFLQRPVRWLQAISDFRATYSGGPNFSFDYCSERINEEQLDTVDLSSLQSLYNGSERVQMPTMKRFAGRFEKTGFSIDKFTACYGLAEATLAVTASDFAACPASLRLDANELKKNRVLADAGETGIDIVGCGKPLGDTELLIIDPITQAETKPGETGEICVFSKSVTKGYYGIADKSNFLYWNSKKFLRTGDLGFVSDGELFVTGRMKDIIIIRGENHDPSDIESTCFSSHESLSQNAAGAFSVEIDGVERLIVVQEARRTFLRRCDFEEVIDSILANISQNHKLAPYDVAIIPPGTLPKTSSGKIQRSKCREMWILEQFRAVAQLRPETKQYA